MGLFGVMSVSVGALAADEAALQVTSDNIANINTEGYSRKRVVLEEDSAHFAGGVIEGGGVHVKAVEGLRSDVIELMLHEQTQVQAGLHSFVSAMSQVDSSFADVENGIGAKMDQFFGAIVASGSDDPADIPSRQSVLVAAQNLAVAFRATALNLGSFQKNIDDGVRGAAAKIGELAAEIASLNKQLGETREESAESGTLWDQRTQAIRNLAAQIDVSIVSTEAGVTVTTKSGEALVVGSKAYQLGTELQQDGYYHVMWGEADITSEISGGALGGLLRARQQIETAKDSLSDLATAFAASINSANAAGRDLNGEAGAELFGITDVQAAAATMQVTMSDPRKLAMSSDGSVGDNGNLQNFLSVRDGALIDGQTPSEYYGQLVSSIGNDVSEAKVREEQCTSAIARLADQRGSVSGVSLDEEAANLLRLQRAYQANARVVSTVDEMLQTLLGMA